MHVGICAWVGACVCVLGSLVCVHEVCVCVCVGHIWFSSPASAFVPGQIRGVRLVLPAVDNRLSIMEIVELCPR